MPENDTVLKPVPREKAFYFYSDIGNYTGKSAASLKEFAEKIEDVDVTSLGFHLRRGTLKTGYRSSEGRRVGKISQG